MPNYEVAATSITPRARVSFMTLMRKKGTSTRTKDISRWTVAWARKRVVVVTTLEMKAIS